MSYSSSAAQSDDWTVVERCAGLPSAPPEAAFDGLLVTVADDAARGFRASVNTTYVLSFAGGNFLNGIGVSPDGRHLAVPHGIINTVTSSDVRYVVQEIRIVTTETVPRIVERLPWRASFPVGTRFTSSGDIPPVEWVSNDEIRFVSGTLSEGQSPVVVNVFDGTQRDDAAGYDAVSRSPDGTRAVSYQSGRLTLVAGSDETTRLPQTPAGVLQVAWSPDGGHFAMTDIADGAVVLRLYDGAGTQLETIAALPPEQVLWNLRWSPDGTRLAFTAFDPQTDENRLHVADLDARTVTDTCLPVVSDADGRRLAGLAWAPDSTRVAILTAQTSATPQVQIYDIDERTRYSLVAAAGRLLGWYP